MLVRLENEKIKISEKTEIRKNQELYRIELEYDNLLHK